MQAAFSDCSHGQNSSGCKWAKKIGLKDGQTYFLQRVCCAGARTCGLAMQHLRRCLAAKLPACVKGRMCWIVRQCRASWSGTGPYKAPRALHITVRLASEVSMACHMASQVCCSWDDGTERYVQCGRRDWELAQRALVPDLS